MTTKAASLTSSLLTPKGAAIPSGLAPPVEEEETVHEYSDPEFLERDQKTLREQVALLKSSFSTDKIAKRKTDEEVEPSPIVSNIIARAAQQRQKVAARQARALATHPKVDDHGRVKTSLRLDEKRHLILKLAAAHLNQSAQEFLVEAFDQHIEKVAKNFSGSELAAMVDDVYRK